MSDRMNNKIKPAKIISWWLFIGVFMVFIQVMLGGITRLTGSGLSITQWDVVMGSLPPLDEQQWQKAFNAYQQFPQYKMMNNTMTLSGFKSIFWWEYIHRLWARLMAVVFLIPFLFFLFKRWIDKELGRKLIILFLLGAAQGALGWVMVASGLIDQPWVNPIDLSAHLILALILYVYLFGMALENSAPRRNPLTLLKYRGFSFVLMLILFIQLFYGALMAGNHAALFYPTFPDFNGSWLPDGLFKLSPLISNFFQNIAMIQLIHRSLGLLLGVLVFIFYFRIKKDEKTSLLSRAVLLLPVLVCLQILLGILVLLNSVGSIPVFLGVAHQMNAMLLLTDMALIYFEIQRVTPSVERIRVPAEAEPAH
jgi:heme a synthase